MPDRRQQLRELYGFDFPEHFFRFWTFAQHLRPLEPLKALDDLALQLVGPFEVLAGRFDRHSPRLSHLLHWRYYLDPPEFFTVLAGGAESEHWGYYFDDPASDPGCVAYYDSHGDFEMSVDGNDLFQAVRLYVEDQYGGCELHYKEGLMRKDDFKQHRAFLADFRKTLTSFATAERREVGLAYTDLYGGLASRQVEVIGETCEGMGVIVPPEQYRPPSLDDAKLWRYLGETDNPLDVVAEARQALREGFPGTALKLGKDLWAIGGERHTEYAYELLDAAYTALGREVLREVLRVHRANRDLPSVDILENEG